MYSKGQLMLITKLYKHTNSSNLSQQAAAMVPLISCLELWQSQCLMATQQKMREDSKVFQVISSVHNLMNEWQNSGGQDQFWKTKRTIRENKSEPTLLVEDLQEDREVSWKSHLWGCCSQRKHLPFSEAPELNITGNLWADLRRALRALDPDRTEDFWRRMEEIPSRTEELLAASTPLQADTGQAGRCWVLTAGGPNWLLLQRPFLLHMFLWFLRLSQRTFGVQSKGLQ